MFEIELNQSAGEHLDYLVGILQFASDGTQAGATALEWANDAVRAGMPADLAMGVASLAVLTALKPGH